MEFLFMFSLLILNELQFYYLQMRMYTLAAECVMVNFIFSFFDLEDFHACYFVW